MFPTLGWTAHTKKKYLKKKKVTVFLNINSYSIKYLNSDLYQTSWYLIRNAEESSMGECYKLTNKKLLTRNQFLPLRDSYSGKKKLSNDL